MRTTKKHFVFIILLFFLTACSDKSKDSFELGKIAYDSGRLEQAKALFKQIDSLSQWGEPARKYLRMIDSVSVINNAAIESLIQAATEKGEYFTEQNLVLDTSQYQLINYTCALYLNTPEEASIRDKISAREYAKEQAKQDSIAWASRSSDSAYSAEHDQDGGDGGDDGMWYQYKYEEQFETLKGLGIPAIRVTNKPYVRFIDKQNKKVWTLINKEGAFFDDGIVLFAVDKKPIHLYLTDFGSDEMRKYFSNK